MSGTLQRIKQYIDYKGITVSLFEKSAGFSNGAFASQLKNNKTIGVDKLENILKAYNDVSPEWLLTGEGKMLKNKLQQENKTSVTIPVSTLTEGIPLISSDGMTDYSKDDISAIKHESECFIVPTFKGADFLIPIRGSSMCPKYNSGDIVACKRLNLDTFFQWNKVYVLDTEQGALIKRVQKGTDNEHVLIVSDNENYIPFEIHRREIRSLAIVLGVIRLE